MQNLGPVVLCRIIKTVFPSMGISITKEKTVGKQSYLCNGYPYSGKTVYLFIEIKPWNRNFEYYITWCYILIILTELKISIGELLLGH